MRSSSIMALAAPPANDRKRVKVYELKSNDWFDRGTGFCVGSIVNVSHTPRIPDSMRTPSLYPPSYTCALGLTAGAAPAHQLTACASTGRSANMRSIRR